MKTILVIAAHPDDELLGSAGTLIKHVAAGDKVFALILGEGLMARDNANPDNLHDLQAMARAAGAIVGCSGITFASFADNAFDTVKFLDIVKTIEHELATIKPNVVYTHHEYDLNVDHRLTCEAVLTACRPVADFCPETIYSFETLSSTEWQSKDHKQFKPNVYVNIEDVLEKKVLALREYTSEMRSYPHSRSEEGLRILAQYRGLESNLRAAEALYLVRQIIS
ncbi:MAG: hypothetical protein A2821_04815 [Candidatus Magasanikbacteria bacterium RIFCSPHIGHO2_01_FULL_41_23]|uniref:GlcNAc-PI de-N-acetylase n=1 Tax=Candidatus Magasanikbacteria bacterium RIFCSPLOWO2_01_FULL_40_15 TaxID=1798686 RepID=A0A1F6N3U3_9BACT|nr:MAG: hypothetical protein A2821_04815 [Candidatus Magasanikbacteria bacterium RIFCSPHIGHO2_01_FULL_41_23]OGH76631.1 MAG: hypothetical protein A3F22_00750 [Candidatus Magasanikbacteria bacterium RIFCSPHIGHO2_12_FULL_41_16]OGH78542.1 MAG: hypothetical protein A2983_01185 [Candidatus Magasanikbacteria bacterium RIFCSPLOWO2_01_FULL_40_15]